MTPINEAIRLEHDGPIAIITIDNPPVNAGSLAVRKGILEAIRHISSNPDVKAVVLIGAGKTFVSGSDIREFSGPLADPQLPAVIAAVEECPKPVVAALSGAALGGGFELALGCDARIASPETVVGLPEVKLGIIPGAGGTQRLPRLVGIAKSVEIITSGRRLQTEEAQQLGLLDAVTGADLRSEAIAFARSWKGGKRNLADKPVPADSTEAVAESVKAAQKKGRGRPAIEQAIQSIQRAAHVPLPDGLKAERAVFQELRASEEAAALRHLFFAEREASRVPGLSGVRARSVASVGVIGAGTMGTGIALALADAGISTTVVEKEAAALERGMKRARENYDRAVTAQRLTKQDAERCLACIRADLNFSSLSNCDLVIEAVFEDVQIKKEVLQNLDKILKPGAVIASNTSYLNLDELALATTRPSDVVGLHFFSPANVMRLLEVVQGRETTPDVLATALALGKRIGKVSVVAKVGEGFIGNRIYNAYRTQCEFMLEEGAYPQQVDAALEGFGFAMGPFAVGDLSGLDIAWRTRQRNAATRDPRARYVDILDRLCEAGSFGQKAGRGWYKYEPNARKGLPYEDARRLIEDASARKGIHRKSFVSEEIVSRALGAMVNEAALLLEEGIAQRSSDIDIVMVNGYGFPNYKGGPIFWAARLPRAELRRVLASVQEATGHGFRRGNVDKMLEEPAGN